MTIRECIIANPNLSNKQIADLMGTTVGTVQTKRNQQKKRELNPGLAQECDTVGIDFDNVNHFWYKGKHYSVHVKGAEAPTYAEMRDEIVEEMKTYAPLYPSIIYPQLTDGHMLVLDPADVHLGKLSRSFETGEEYNSQIAVKRVKEGVHGVIQKSSGFAIDKTALIIGNDIMHVDGPQNTTTKGTRQDVGNMWWENFQMAKRIYIDTIETLLQIAPLHVQYDPSNHDYMNGFFLADTIRSHFHNTKHITWNTNLQHRKYFTYGTNLIGTTHGDGAKAADLPFLMAQEAATEWAVCRHRYFYKHHIHHDESKDFGSVNVKTLRSPSAADAYHHKYSFQHAPQAIEGFVHHKQNGRVAMISHIF